MSTTVDQLPITETIEPADQQELIDACKQAYENETPIYPIGGGTSLGFGLPARREGIGLSLARLNRVVDYPAGDMTITVEAGITMKQLRETLAAERQCLPVDVPQPDQATLGGVIATNFNGPRRYGQGSLRDFVIGISAVDGRGTQFKGGGRVVKNVAGYDFCKLLTGSLGTLGIITQVTLKLKPLPPATVLVTCLVSGTEGADLLLNTLVRSETTPSAIELLTGPHWDSDPVLASEGPAGDDQIFVVVGLDGPVNEVNWMVKQFANEWRGRGTARRKNVIGQNALGLWDRLAEFPAGDAPLTIKASVAPSGTTRMIAAVRQLDPNCSVQAHAGNGIVIARFSEFPAEGLSRALVGRLQPLAATLHGNVVVLANPGGAEMTHRCVWGGADAPWELMARVKDQFDPKDLLNPGRFVYS